ncbi:MAG: hypothetical protein HN816_14220 [Gammaproteobacteria bacterium]|nr:hypothetical protein [Gammaproteobacteria bacterium]
MGSLAALVPKPRVNLTRFHGVLSRGGLPPRSKLREHVVGEGQQMSRKRFRHPPRTRHIRWCTVLFGAQRLKRVFGIKGAPANREMR